MAPIGVRGEERIDRTRMRRIIADKTKKVQRQSAMIRLIRVLSIRILFC
jgi:hypothetical protein